MLVRVTKKIPTMVELGSHFLNRGADNDDGKGGLLGKIPVVVEPRSDSELKFFAGKLQAMVELRSHDGQGTLLGKLPTMVEHRSHGDGGPLMQRQRELVRRTDNRTDSQWRIDGWKGDARFREGGSRRHGVEFWRAWSERAQKTRTSGRFQLAKASRFKDLMSSGDLWLAAGSNGGGLRVLSAEFGTHLLLKLGLNLV